MTFIKMVGEIIVPPSVEGRSIASALVKRTYEYAGRTECPQIILFCHLPLIYSLILIFNQDLPHTLQSSSYPSQYMFL